MPTVTESFHEDKGQDVDKSWCFVDRIGGGMQEEEEEESFEAWIHGIVGIADVFVSPSTDVPLSFERTRRRPRKN